MSASEIGMSPAPKRSSERESGAPSSIWLAQGVTRAPREADIRDFRFDDLRHSAGTRTLLAHRNLKTVQRMLGHKDIKTTLRYTRSDVEDVRAAMEAVEKAQSRHTVGRAGEKKDR